MEELLKKLLEADLLSAETKTELETAFNEQLTEAIESAKKKAGDEVKAQLSEQWVAEKTTLIEAIDLKVEEFLKEELTQLKGDIDRFRDLEAEQAEKLVEAKGHMADQLRTDLAELIEKLDTFLEIRLTAELEELREDITAEKKRMFGRRMFEAFADEYHFAFADDESVQAKLQEAEARLKETTKQLDEAEKGRDTVVREMKMKKLLEPLSGRQRDIMETVLSNVATDDLEDGYKTFVGRILRETQTTDPEKEKTVLQEGDGVSTEPGVKTKLVTGDDPGTKTQDVKKPISEQVVWARHLAGIDEK